MSQGFDLEALVARTALIGVVTAYAMALDARDWTAFRALFEDEIEVDYSSLGSIRAAMPAQAWVDRCKVLGGFDATQHKVSNFVIDHRDEAARVTSYVDAAHFIGDLEAYACGTYVHDLRRHGGVWKIRACGFTVAGYPGGRAQFDRALDAARAAYAAGDSA
jgi:hypothetical protein